MLLIDFLGLNRFVILTGSCLANWNIDWGIVNYGCWCEWYCYLAQILNYWVCLLSFLMSMLADELRDHIFIISYQNHSLDPHQQE